MGIFKAYDVRGVFGDDLTEKDAYLIGYYLPKFLKIDEIKIGHDLRLSYAVLTKFLIRGLLDANCKVIYLGKCSTPNFYYSLFEGCDSGVMITASHNSKEYNGFKLMHKFCSFDSRNGLFDFEKVVLEDSENKEADYDLICDSIRAMMLGEFFDENEIEVESPIESYTKFMKDFYDRILTDDERKVLKDVNFSLDFSSGVSSLAIVPFLDMTTLDYNLVNEKPDGSFPVHEPNPFKAVDFVKSADLGDSQFTVVFDGDGDRIAFFDEEKEFVLTDYVIAIFMDYFRKHGKNFVVDLRVSRILEDIASENDLSLNKIRVGRSFYQDFMNEHVCAFGAELSGHMFFKDFRYLDNPDVALVYMLKIVAGEILESGLEEFKFSKLVDKYKKYCKIPETNLKVSDAGLVLESLKEKFGGSLVMDIDGYSFDLGEFWFNVRKSNTEPIIRINFEGNEVDKTEDEFEKLVSFIKSV